jgi:hypothetical protein
MTQPTPPSEVKKSKRMRVVAIGMLIVGVAVGVAIGAALVVRSQFPVWEYTRVQVYKGGYTPTEWGYFGYFGSEIIVGSQAFSATQGQTYTLLHIEVVVSEVKNDYLVLYVKSR